MSIGTSLFVVAAGALLRYAVDARVAGIELHTAGTILMVVGVAGLIIGLVAGFGRSPGAQPRPGKP